MFQIYMFHATTLQSEKIALKQAQEQVNRFLQGLGPYSEDIAVQTIGVNTHVETVNDYSAFNVVVTVQVTIDNALRDRTKWLEAVQECYEAATKEPEAAPDNFDPFLPASDELP